MVSRVASVCTVLLTATAAGAHEGHGHPEHADGLMHYIVNPSHAASGVLAAVVAVAVCVLLKKLASKRSGR
jgi:hypothetical protein